MCPASSEGLRKSVTNAPRVCTSRRTSLASSCLSSRQVRLSHGSSVLAVTTEGHVERRLSSIAVFCTIRSKTRIWNILEQVEACVFGTKLQTWSLGHDFPACRAVELVGHTRRATKATSVLPRSCPTGPSITRRVEHVKAQSQQGRVSGWRARGDA